MSKDFKIYITGASCAGVTTLGAEIARLLSIQHIDVDDYYWLPTDPPFQTKRPPEDRVKLIHESQGNNGWVLTGSFDGWGDGLIHDVDLIVFLDTATSIRMARLITREKKRHGDRILPGGDMFEIHTAFRDWAEKYDDPHFSGRNRRRHQLWLSQQNAPILQLDGARNLDELSCAVIAKIENTSHQKP